MPNLKYIGRANHVGRVQTRVPSALKQVSNALSREPFLGYNTSVAMYTELFVDFLTNKPYLSGVEWQRSKSSISFKSAQVERTDFDQVNIELADATLPDGRIVTGVELSELVKEEARNQGVSIASFVCTAIWYLCHVKHPIYKSDLDALH